MCENDDVVPESVPKSGVVRVQLAAQRRVEICSTYRSKQRRTNSKQSSKAHNSSRTSPEQADAR